MDPHDWLARVAEALGTTAPDAAEVEDLLAVASVAAHASQRWAAPVTCAMAAAAGLTAAQARELVEGLVADAAGSD